MKIYLYSLLVILSLPKLSNGQTATRDNAGLQGNAGAVSGFFETYNPVNYPTGATDWWHLLDVRHSNTVNNYAMQFSGSFFDQDLYFRKTNNDPAQPWSKVLLQTNDKVGIGTNVPATRLSVNSGSSAPTSRNLVNSITVGVGNANGTNKYLGQLGFMSYDTDFSAPKMVAFIGAEATETYDSATKTGSLLRFFTGSNNGNNPVERMVINNYGNVGIGTATPADKLSVNGRIRAQEVKVETANWPDYVFTKEYKLQSLAETETHIKEKGHLPGIPSAAEVKENGVELGEMNKKLLEKIEELTLHLIEMKKENEDQKTSINGLLNRIQSLENKQKNNLN